MLARKYSLAHTRTGTQVPLPTVIVVAVLAFLQWQPPGWHQWLEGFRWYFMAAAAGYLFVLQRGRINLSNARFYILFNALSWLGVLLSLFRTPDPESVLYMAVSLAVPFFLGLVMLSTLSAEHGRKVWLYALFIAGFLWAYEVINLWYVYGENIRHYLYGPGKDHNLISVNFAMAATGSLAVALHGDFNVSKATRGFIRIAGFTGCLLFFACTFLSYSRSGFIVASIGIFFTLFTLFFSKTTRGVMVVIFIFLMAAAAFMASVVQVTNPTWFIKFGEIVRLDDPNTSVYVRTVLLQKAWSVIGENPLIGVGPGIFKTIYDPVIGHQSFYLVHNSYLTAWVENGILGLCAYLLWVVLWIRFFLTRWHELELTRRILVLMFIPFFVMLLFLDIGGFPLQFMLLIFSGIGAQSEHETGSSLSYSRAHQA
jgi:O-antigen ligase